MRTQLSEKEISDLTFIVMAINAWNRVNVGFRTVPGIHDKAFGLDKVTVDDIKAAAGRWFVTTNQTSIDSRPAAKTSAGGQGGAR